MLNHPLVEKAMGCLQSVLLNAGSTLQLLGAVAALLLVIPPTLRLIQTRCKARNNTGGAAGIAGVLGSALLVSGVAATEVYAAPALGGLPWFLVLLAGALGTLLLLVVPLTMLVFRASYRGSLFAWIGALVVAGLVVVGANLGFQSLKSNAPVIAQFKGEVRHRPTPFSSWETVSRTNLSLVMGSEITTKENSELLLNLGAAGQVSLRPQSRLRLRLADGQVALRVDEGRIIASIKPGAMKSKFSVKTPAATTGILGTKFIIDSNAQKTTTATVGDGSVALSGKATGSKSVTVKTGEAAGVPFKGQPETPHPADPKDLAEIETLFPKPVGFIR